MWITLLLFAQVGCEWVQISQQHYRKPYQPYNQPGLPDDASFDYEEDMTTKTNNLYANQSMSDYKWKDSFSHNNNKGFVTKVEADKDYVRGDKTSVSKVNNPFKQYFDHEEDADAVETYAIKVNSQEGNQHLRRPTNNENTVISAQNSHDSKQDVPYANTKRHELEKTVTQDDIFEESYHEIPNVGSIKKVHLDSRTVRTPILKEISRKQFGTSSTHDVKLPIDEKETSHRPVIIWKSENQDNKVIPGIIQKVSKEDLKIKAENISRYEEIPLNDQDHSEMKKIFMTHAMQQSEGIPGEKFNQVPNINFEKPVFVTREEFEDDGLVTISIEDNAASSDEKTTKSNKPPTKETSKPKIENETKELPTKDKVNTIENVLKFMRIVTDTISRNTRRSVGSKVRYLENLQDTIMANIEHRINTLWPDDPPRETPSRKARSTATPRGGGGHVEFPSSESALMTISFLTFAVYLIKLVLQVIHTYKNKTMLMTPTVVTAVGRTITAVYRRADAT